MRPLIVSGIGTGVGKTIVSAILTEMLEADYWKPISCGDFDERDSAQIKSLVSPNINIHKEAYHFDEPVSPHQAARGVDVDEDIKLPSTNAPIIIEAVGGVMVPVKYTLTLDLFSKWKADWIVVSQNYLGSINHTLMTVDVLKHRGITPLGIVFNGPRNRDSESFIFEYTSLQILGRVNQETVINREVIWNYARTWKQIPFWNKKIENIHGTLIHK